MKKKIELPAERKSCFTLAFDTSKHTRSYKHVKARYRNKLTAQTYTNAQKGTSKRKTRNQIVGASVKKR